MSEPKRFTVGINTLVPYRRDDSGPFYLADDPALAEQKREADEAAKLKELLGVKTLNEAFVWKRKAEALEKLERLRDNPDAQIRIGKLAGGSTIIDAIPYFLDPNHVPLPTRTFSAPSLIEAIEAIKEE